ncbi:MFS transporter [Vibrio profundum]|uniref:MFS transporter n=1 Tax=Vibrio profundum TaxID=2910247 RepID=UPI003D1121D6
MDAILPSIRIRDFLSLYAVILLGFLGYALTITMFIPMLMDEHFLLLPTTASTSLRATLSGGLLAMYPLGQFFGSPIIGRLSDVYGRKKVLMLSLLACTIGFAGIALSIEFKHLGLLFASSFLTGLCESNMAISQSVISDRTHNESLKNKLIGYGYSACSLGYIIGPLLASVSLNYSLPFLITSILVPFLMLWLWLDFDDQYIINQSQKVEKLTLGNSLGAIKSIFSQKKLLKFYMINFAIFFSVQGLYRVIPLYIVDSWNPTLKTFSYLIAFVSSMCFFSNIFILGPLSNRYTTKKLLAGLLLIGGAIVIFVTVPAQFNWIWLTYGLAVIPTVMALPTCTTWLIQQVSKSEQGQVLGNNQALLVLGEATSAALGGAIAAIWIPLPVISLGVILLLTALAISQIKEH